MTDPKTEDSCARTSVLRRLLRLVARTIAREIVVSTEESKSAEVEKERDTPG